MFRSTLGQQQACLSAKAFNGPHYSLTVWRHNCLMTGLRHVLA